MKRVPLCVLVATAIVMMSPRDLTNSAEAADGGADPVAAAQIRPEVVAHVEELTVEQAEALVDQASRPNGPTLSFDRLKRLSPEVAKKFARHRGTISLRGLTTLSPETAEVLAQLQNELHLDGLVELSPETAEALSKHTFNSLSLNGLRNLSPEVARALAKHAGYRLCLDGVTTLSPEQAEVIAGHRGMWLSLCGLTSLSPEVAEKLANHEGELDLSGLTSLSSESLRRALPRGIDDALARSGRGTGQARGHVSLSQWPADAVARDGRGTGPLPGQHLPVRPDVTAPGGCRGHA